MNKRKIVEEKTLKAIKMVRYEGDPPHRWFRVTPLTVSETDKRRVVRDQVEHELRQRGYLPDAESLVVLGQRLRAARQRAGLSLTTLAEKSGVEKAALSRIEAGKNPNPSVRTLRRIARALGRELLITFPLREQKAKSAIS